ncbi:Hypothetical protein PHPALM_10926 [Phytophthora palmivora]|uniref:Uncharacterized protein n=1 Tax=Phytophthora palmivora TaxID=4796 RepID=A0A2P4Y3G8_9STRA|nr:Hypothetical protein PHPALM_10926 [Phytophthora palmivora]
MPGNAVTGALALLGPAHSKQLQEFQYVEVVSAAEATVTVKTIDPDGDDQRSEFEVAKDIVELRLVPYERQLWPGSYLAHPVAFVKTEHSGVDSWSYGVVSGYTASETTHLLHITSAEGPTRFPLTDTQSVIKVDSLNYALQPGAGVNVVALSPLELLRQQDAIVAACRKRRAGVPSSRQSSLY